MEQKSKRNFHTSWDQAWRAENERERARLACCIHIATPSRLKQLAENVAREISDLKVNRFGFLDWRRINVAPSNTSARYCLIARLGEVADGATQEDHNTLTFGLHYF